MERSRRMNVIVHRFSSFQFSYDFIYLSFSSDIRHHAALLQRSCLCSSSTPWGTPSASHVTPVVTASSCQRSVSQDTIGLYVTWSCHKCSTSISNSKWIHRPDFFLGFFLPNFLKLYFLLIFVCFVLPDFLPIFLIFPNFPTQKGGGGMLLDAIPPPPPHPLLFFLFFLLKGGVVEGSLSPLIHNVNPEPITIPDPGPNPNSVPISIPLTL